MSEYYSADAGERTRRNTDRVPQAGQQVFSDPMYSKGAGIRMAENTAEVDSEMMRPTNFSKPSKQTYKLNFHGFLAVRLMEFDYQGKHYSYHGRKLENAIKRLCAESGPKKASTPELVVWGQAAHDWKILNNEQCSEDYQPANNSVAY